MLVFNRRKRNAFYDQQYRIYASKLLAAIETEKAGLPLTNDQALVLNRERLKIAEDKRKYEQSWSYKIKHALSGDLKAVDEPGPKLYELGDIKLDGGRIPTEREVLELIGVNQLETLKQAEGKVPGERDEGDGGKVLKQEVEDTGRRKTQSTGARGGGMLDQMAANIFNKATGK